MKAFAIAAVMFVVCFSAPSIARAAEQPIALSDFHAELQADHVASVEIRQDELVGRMREPQMVGGVRVDEFRVALPQGLSSTQPFVQWLLQNRGNARVTVSNPEPNWLMNVLLPLIPWLLIFLFIWLFVFRALRRTGRKPGDPLPVVIVNPNFAKTLQDPPPLQPPPPPGL